MFSLFFFSSHCLSYSSLFIFQIYHRIMIFLKINIHIYIIQLCYIFLDYPIACMYRKWGNVTILNNIFLFEALQFGSFFRLIFSPLQHFFSFEYVSLAFWPLSFSLFLIRQFFLQCHKNSLLICIQWCRKFLPHYFISSWESNICLLKSVHYISLSRAKLHFLKHSCTNKMLIWHSWSLYFYVSATTP